MPNNKKSRFSRYKKQQELYNSIANELYSYFPKLTLDRVRLIKLINLIDIQRHDIFNCVYQAISPGGAKDLQQQIDFYNEHKENWKPPKNIKLIAKYQKRTGEKYYYLMSQRERKRYLATWIIDLLHGFTPSKSQSTLITGILFEKFNIVSFPYNKTKDDYPNKTSLNDAYRSLIKNLFK